MGTVPEPVMQAPVMGATPAHLQSLAPVTAPTAPPSAPLPQPPPGFIAYQASDGRIVFVQETAPAQPPPQPLLLQHYPPPAMRSPWTLPPPNVQIPTTISSSAPSMSVTAPLPQPLHQPLAAAPLFAPPAAPASVADSSLCMPPPLESPKLPWAVGVPGVPPPMCSPRVTGNVALSVQQAVAAGTMPGLSGPTFAYAPTAPPPSSVWVDASPG